MQIYWDFKEFKAEQPSVVTLGTFDGVHQGHLRIIERINCAAEEKQALSTLITFEPHPQLVLDSRRETELRLLTSVEEKIDLLSRSGLQRLVVANFTRDFAVIEPEQFIRDYLVERMRMKHIVIGHDHAFGKKRRGNLQLLQQMSDGQGFTVEAVEAVINGGQTISSTQIRKALQNGDVETANRLLGRAYSLTGKVVKGDKRGSFLGFPTANIQPFSRYKLVPKPGIYASRLLVGDKIYNSATYIGIRPTFELHEPVIEVHVMGFKLELYTQTVELQFYQWIREERHFDRVEELIEQIKIDIEKANRILTCC
ncbi:bifunctional riboflavin kinase/FAD synthetase [candidate division KSB1 bacterium]|nr:bifunctional riboflavin kinase/FAD synthetase [candidate division KSB1 bacterium]